MEIVGASGAGGELGGFASVTGRQSVQTCFYPIGCGRQHHPTDARERPRLSDNLPGGMSLTVVSTPKTCCGSTLARLSRAAAKAAGARLRRIGLLSQRVDWPARATACERCPLRVIHRNVSYCGRPFLRDLNRDPARDGCGCPTLAKAKDPSEHCPIDALHRPASRLPDGRCTCKWCALPSQPAGG